MKIHATILLQIVLLMLAVTACAEVTPRIAGGGYHSVALKADATVWTWGLNDQGQLGFGNSSSATLPRKVSFQNYSGKAVSAGENHTLVLLNDGKVRAWGRNASGQLGNSSTTESNLPVLVKDNSGTGDLDNIVAIAAGANHSLAVKKAGTDYSVWSWGNSYASSSLLPVEVSGLTGPAEIITVSAGRYHSVALKSNGTVWTWGLNEYGQLGDGSVTLSSTPIQAGISGVTAIAAGGNHTVALKSDTTAWAWGNNIHGQLGAPSTGNGSLLPVQVVHSVGNELTPLTGVIAIAAGDNHSAAITSDFKVWMFGNDGIAHPQSGTVNNRYADLYTDIDGAAQLAAGRSHTMALDSYGLITSWGSNSAGQLGRGYTADIENRSYPVLGFNVTGTCRVMIGDSCYEAIADAYQAASGTVSILAKIAAYYEPLDFNRIVDMTLTGEVSSELRGLSLTISTGSLVIGNNMTVVVS